MTKPPSPRPLSIKVIAIIFGVTAAVQLIDVRSDIAVIGVVLSGTVAMVVNALQSLLQLWLMVGLWKLREIARRVGIWYSVYGVAVTMWWLESILDDMSEIWRPTGIDPSFVRVGLTASIFCMLMLSLLIPWFLIKRKSAFVKPKTAP